MKSSLDPSLLVTLEQRLGELDLAQTLEASPTATIRPEGKAKPGTRSLPDPERLPRISIDGSRAASPVDEASRHARPTHDLALGALLGEGGMGQVHAAFQHSLAREVAIKTLRDGAGPPEAAALFREAVLTGMLEHPGIVPVHALGIDDTGLPVLVMKRIEGVQWAALIANEKHPAWASRSGDRTVAHLEILMQVCRTVHFAHARGVLHRDIKPENVMLGEFGEVYLVDWGIALRVDQIGPSLTEHLAGTPAYMAPEMVNGAGLDERSDVYLLGATLHEALTREIRNRGPNIAGVLASALAPVPYAYDASVPAELAQICNRATAREPADRFPSVEDLRRAVAEHVRHRGAAALVEQASARAVELAALLESATSGAEDAPPGDLARAYRLANEARFGYAQALREWSDNGEAKEGLAACLALVVDLEVRQGHVDAAEVLLGDLEHPPTSVVARLERARRERTRRADEHQRLQAMAREHDASLGAGTRAIAVGVLTAALTAASLFLVLSEPDLSQTRPERMLQLALVLLGGTIATTAALRKRLLTSPFNRRAAGLLIATSAAIVASRGLAVLEHLSFPTMVVQDQLVIATITTSIALTYLRWIGLVTVVSLAGAFVSAWRPDLAFATLAVTITVLPGGIVLALQRHKREQARANSHLP